MMGYAKIRHVRVSQNNMSLSVGRSYCESTCKKDMDDVVRAVLERSSHKLLVVDRSPVFDVQDIDGLRQKLKITASKSRSAWGETRSRGEHARAPTCWR